MSREPRTHDFQRCRWGHNLEIETTAPDTLEGFCWTTPGPAKGDRIVWGTHYGTAVGEVVESHWRVDVDDMYRIKVRVVEREVAQ